MHLLPEAFESQAGPRPVCHLAGGRGVFFLLDKAELWHHGMSTTTTPTPATTTRITTITAMPGPAAGWALLTGDSVHCFGDGILIASRLCGGFPPWRGGGAGRAGA